jgi:predicted restriction endonuclease
VPIEKTYADFGDAPNDDPKELQLFAARVRRGQPAFRANLIRAYGARCALSNHGPSEVLEAVHIVAHAGSGINELNNGSLMRADLHYLFDAGLIRINPESLKLVVDVSLQDTPYWALKGKKIRPREDGKQPSTKYLIQRWKSDDPPRKG